MFWKMGLAVKAGVHEIDILLIQPVLGQAQALAEALEVDDLPLPQELDDVVDVRIIGQPQNIVIGYPCFLLWHGKIIATKYILKFGNKRLISAILSSKSSYISVLLLRRQASISPKYRKRLTQHSLRKQLAQHQKSQCRIGHGIAIYENLYMIITN